MGVACGGQALIFALVRDINPLSCVGTAVGFTNMAVVCNGAIFQPLVGELLQVRWTGLKSHGVPMFSLLDFDLALAIVPLSFLLAMAIALWALRETYCRPTYHQHATKGQDYVDKCATEISSGSSF